MASWSCTPTSDALPLSVFRQTVRSAGEQRRHHRLPAADRQRLARHARQHRHVALYQRYVQISDEQQRRDEHPTDDVRISLHIQGIYYASVGDIQRNVSQLLATIRKL